MQTSTATAIKAIISTDGSIDPAARARLIKALSATPTPEAQGERLLRRGEVAKRLAVSLRTVDTLHNQGILKKVTLPGRERSAGFRLADVDALLAGNGVAR